MLYSMNRLKLNDYAKTKHYVHCNYIKLDETLWQ